MIEACRKANRKLMVAYRLHYEPHTQALIKVARDAELGKVFGPGGPCHYPNLSLGSAASLLDAAAKRSLSSLAQALMALPGYQAQVESALRALVAPPPAQGERVWEWRPSTVLATIRLPTP